MKAVVTCGFSNENGFHAAGGECLTAVLSDGRRAVLVDSDHLHGRDPGLEHAVAGLRFTEQEQER
ncbi:MAG: hypothetical protein KY449_01010 [Proteobacteria bacterium]|nr:hypothetical protein [Pseudomonadota bacterium]